MEIIKPYEWKGCVCGHTKEESKLAWDTAWEFINKIDMLEELKMYSATHKDNDLYEFKEYLDRNYKYHDIIGESLFNIIDTDELASYLKKKYPNIDCWIETIETHRFKIK